jgi:uncharacterized HAD superfamily protein
VGSDRTVYVDYDDVLCETARSFVDLLATHFERRIPFEAMTSFDLGISFGLSPQEYARFMHLAHRSEMLRALQPMAGARKGLQAFIAQGYRVAVVTGRPATTREASRAWLEAHHLPHHQLIFVDKYGRGASDPDYDGVITLAELAGQAYSFAVEDSADMAVYLAAEMGLSVALLDRPWNRTLPISDPAASGRVYRCADWAAVARRFSQRPPLGPDGAQEEMM